MKRKERKQCSVPVASMLRIRKERITYRYLVLPPSPHISHGSLPGSIVNTPASPRSAVAEAAVRLEAGGGLGGKGGPSAARSCYSPTGCCVWHPRTSPTNPGTRHKEWIIAISSSLRQMGDDPRPETSLAEEQNGKPALWRAAGATVGRLLINSAARAPFQGSKLSMDLGPCRHPYRCRPHSQSLEYVAWRETPALSGIGEISTSLCVHQLLS